MNILHEFSILDNLYNCCFLSAQDLNQANLHIGVLCWLELNGNHFLCNAFTTTVNQKLAIAFFIY